MGIFEHATNNLSFRIDLGIFAINMIFIFPGILFLATLYLVFKLWISDIILKFLVEIFTGEIVDIKEYPKKDRNRMNRYISVGLILMLIIPFILACLQLDTNNILYYIIEITVSIVTVGLVYRNIKKLKNKS
ncbi:MAG: hypothetical protein E6371_03310 [Terrisporobacter othiniensis]|uniref:hypothetical protein n=1 Tax=Terrisporobacter othiniensis TaxID=1577792 RepID=UPI00290E8255|nr:hypothetical protein [Terrisporobacter othiniensis]MDU6983418.1 hypothetical protein [Terrisporobacter othiniensis]